jgi:S-adenosylmethionine-diacylglycerol 3-amino-3-carboxypropyl transferase
MTADRTTEEVDAQAGAGIRERARFDFVRYAAVWEDADILCDALRPAAAGGRVLSIASAGDNALALLTLDPAEVVAVDLSGPQLAACELRLAAFRQLDRDALLGFLGVTPATDRPGTYASLRGTLTGNARTFWDARPDAIAAGVVHCGKFERYLRGFRRFVLPLVHSRRTIDALLEARDADARGRFYRERWDTARWRLLFRLFFSRVMMGRLGRDPAFFTHVEGSVGDRILERTRHALTALPTDTNPYLTYIMTGSYAPNALPRYLRAEHWDPIRSRLDRVRLQRSPAQEVDGPIAAFNLSDIFEYMSPDEHARTYERLVANAAPGARLAYWNLLAPRGVPTALAARVTSHAKAAARLHAQDKAWFYGAFHLDEVTA